MARPLHDVLKGEVFTWSPATQDAFNVLKKAMIFAPVLALPEFSKEFVMETDASGSRIGAVLIHRGHPIAFRS